MKIVSFQAVQVPNNIVTKTDVIVYALSDEGKLYMTDMMCNRGWCLMETQGKGEA